MRPLQAIAKWTACLVLALAASPAFAFTVIDTTTIWNGTQSISAFGVPNTATYGQIVTVPPGASTLFSFSFEMDLPATVAFRGEVYAWDAANSRATGPALYESAPTQTAGSGTFELITFAIPGGVPVIAGQQYVIFATTSRDQGGHSGIGRWGATPPSSYPDGTFVFQNNSTDPALWTSTPWVLTFPFDLAFIAVFGEPVQAIPTLDGPTMLLLAALLALTGAILLRRRIHLA